MHVSYVFRQDLNQIVKNYYDICARENKNPENWLILGRALVDAERFDEARDALENVFESGRFFVFKKGLPRIRIQKLFSYKKNRRLFARAYTETAAVEMHYGNLASAERQLLLAMREFEKDGSDKEYVRAARFLGTLYRISGLYENAEEMFLSIREISRKNGWRTPMADAVGNLGMIYFAREDFCRALAYHEESFALYHDENYLQDAAWQRRLMGICHMYSGQKEKTFRFLREALETFKRENNWLYQARLYADMAMAAEKFQEVKSAMRYAAQAVSKAKKSKDENEIAESRLLAARLKMAGGCEDDSVRRLLAEALKYFRLVGKKDDLANTYSTLGLFYLHRNDLEKAESFFKDSLRIEEQLARSFGMAADFGNLGLVAVRRRDTDAAVCYFDKARRLFKEGGNETLSADFEKRIADLKK